MDTHNEKTCTKCGLVKPVTDYYTYADRRRGVERRPMGKCKTCHGAVARAWALANPERHRQNSADSKQRRLRHRRARRYGLTITELDALTSSQDGRCMICHQVTDELVIDHDHLTGNTRSLLCGPCNLGLGAFRDDPMRLVLAARYLLKHAQWQRTSEVQPPRPAAA